MTINKIASAIARLEGKKSQARIYDIREILGILADMLTEESAKKSLEIYGALLLAGEKRAKRKGRGKKNA